MTTPLKDSCRKHSLLVVKCAVEWGPRHVWGFHRQETGVESESPCPSSRGLWGLWCWGPRWSRCARRARIRKVARPCRLDRSCTALKVAFGSVLSSSCQIISHPLSALTAFYSWYSVLGCVLVTDFATASLSMFCRPSCSTFLSM